MHRYGSQGLLALLKHFHFCASSQGHAGWWRPPLPTGEIWWAWFDFGLWSSWMQIFSWTLNCGPAKVSPAKRVKGKRRQVLFWPLALKPLTPVLLHFQQCIKAGNFKVSVKQEDTAFPGTRVALIKIGLYWGMFCFVFEPKKRWRRQRGKWSSWLSP